MGQTNSHTTKCKQMQCGHRVDVQGWSLFGLCTPIGWGWGGYLFFNHCRHHTADLLGGGASLARSQLTLLCQVLSSCEVSSTEELFGGYETLSYIHLVG